MVALSIRAGEMRCRDFVSQTASLRSGSAPTGPLHRGRVNRVAEGVLQPFIDAAVYPSLVGRKVIVSGGASGIGEGIVEAFVRQGAAVAFLDVLETEGAALVGRLG